MVYNLGLIRKYLSNDSAVIVFKAFILSRIEYGSIFCARKSIIERLQKIVNRSLRICYRAKYDESNFNLHVRAQLLPLRLRRKIATLNQMYLVNQRLAKERERNVTTELRSLRMPTRQSKSNFIKCEFPRSEWYRKSLVYQGPRYWEILPTRLKNCNCILDFKREVTEYYTSIFRGEEFV